MDRCVRDMTRAATGVKVFYLTVTTCAVLFTFCVYRTSDMTGSAREYVVPVTEVTEVTERLFAAEDETMPVSVPPSDMPTIHKRRRNHVMHHCKSMEDHFSQKDINEVTARLIHSSQTQLVYCPIPKNGCSFWKRVFSILNGHRNDSGVFNLSSTAIHLDNRRVGYLNDLTPFQRLQALQQSAKFVFARDPYERLFSGYLDKFFAPDAPHHALVARKFRRGGEGRGRGNGGRVTSPCEPGDAGVTFREFLTYVSNTVGVPVNEHFRQQHRICLPCRVGFDLVGKMETFHRDAAFILRSVGVDPASVWGPEDRFEESSDVNIMDDVAHRSFSRCRPSWCRCLSPYRRALRLWVLLQARGFLSVEDPLPVTPAQAENVTLEQFQALAREAYFRIPEDRRAVVKRQRHRAMIEAYHSVEPAILARVQRYVSEDCQLFGYRCSVAERFDASTIPDRPRFHFEEILKTDR